MSGLKFFTVLEETMRNCAVLRVNLSDDGAMFMKKLLSSALLLSLFTTTANAGVIGVLPKLNATEAQFEATTVQNGHDTNTLSALFSEKMKNEKNSIRFYNSIAQMQMALNRGEVDSLALSDIRVYTSRCNTLQDTHSVLTGYAGGESRT